jgi:hypothetical protein
MPLRITADDILAHASLLEDKPLRTLHQGKSFSVMCKDDVIFFDLHNGKPPRPHPKKYLKEVCATFNKTNSFKPIAYVDLTFNASYTLALIASYLGALADGQIETTKKIGRSKKLV